MSTLPHHSAGGFLPQTLDRIRNESQQLQVSGYTNTLAIQSQGILLSCELPGQGTLMYTITFQYSMLYPAEPPGLRVIEQGFDAYGQIQDNPLTVIVPQLTQWSTTTTMLELIREIEQRLSRGEFVRGIGSTGAETIPMTSVASTNATTVLASSTTNSPAIQHIPSRSLPPTKHIQPYPQRNTPGALIPVVVTAVVTILLVLGGIAIWQMTQQRNQAQIPRTSLGENTDSAAVLVGDSQETAPRETSPTTVAGVETIDTQATTDKEARNTEKTVETQKERDTNKTVEARVELTTIARQQETRAALEEQTQTAQAQVEATATHDAWYASLHAEEGERVARHLSDSFGIATSHFNPQMDQLLLDNGYTKNLIVLYGKHGVQASQVGPATGSVWMRDLDYAMSGYSYVIGNMTSLRENVELFLDRVTPEGLVPESISVRGPVYPETIWDTRPNLIHATYVYVSKTGDRTFYRTHRDKLLNAGRWIVSLDEDGDGLPDKNNFPYGWYNSVQNSVRHTYAIAKFYAAFLELAELEMAIGEDAAIWQDHASRIRNGFHQNFADGGKGYWVAGQAWPIAWHRSDGGIVQILETFGVFEALRSGLIAASDESRYDNLMQALHGNLANLIDSPTPMRLTFGGYEDELLRTDTFVPKWKLDASAPWIVGIAAPAYAQAGYPDDALTLLDRYAEMANRTNPPVMQFAAGPEARYGSGQDEVYSPTWDCSAWFMAVYGGHYGIQMTLSALIVAPHPFKDIPSDGIANVSYQGSLVQMSLDAQQNTYALDVDKSIRAILRPIGTDDFVRVNGNDEQNEVDIILEPGKRYVVESVP